MTAWMLTLSALLEMRRTEGLESDEQEILMKFLLLEFCKWRRFSFSSYYFSCASGIRISFHQVLKL